MKRGEPRYHAAPATTTATTIAAARHAGERPDHITRVMRSFSRTS
jgi:hypothetical protein